MKLPGQLMMLFLLVSNFCIGQDYLIPKKSLYRISEEHKFLKRFSYPDPDTTIVDSLIHSNFNYFDSLVNIAFLVKHDSLYDTRFYALINQLKIDTSESVLLKSALELSNYGLEALIALDEVSDTARSFQYWRHIVRTIVLGYEYEDFITTVGPDLFEPDIYSLPLQRTYFNMHGILHNERENLQNSLHKFITSSSYSIYREKFHQVVLDAFKKGELNSDYKYAIIQLIIKQEVMHKEETYLNDYRPLIDTISETDALSIIEFIDSNSPGDYYPQLFIDLLENSNEKIVMRVIGASSNCWDEIKCEQVKFKLLNFFNGNVESLKFHSAFALMHDCKYPLAYDYLMSVVEQNRNNERYTAISWLGDACNAGLPMSDKLNSVLSQYLYSNDAKIKRATIETYLTYNSPNVIIALIPFVDYELEFIAKQIVNKILAYENKSFAIEQLQAYIASGKGGEKHKQILEKLK